MIDQCRHSKMTWRQRRWALSTIISVLAITVIGANSANAVSTDPTETAAETANPTASQLAAKPIAAPATNKRENSLTKISYTPAYVAANFDVWENDEFDRFIINRNFSLADFNKVLFFPMTFDRLKISLKTSSDLAKNWNDSSWKEMDRICGFFDYFAKKKFKRKDDLQLTFTGGDDVLAVEFRMTEFVPQHSKDGSWDSATVGEESFTNLGTLYYRAVIAHSQTGDLIAVIEDATEIAPPKAMVRNITGQNIAWRNSFKRILDSFYLALKEAKAADMIAAKNNE